MPNSKTVVIAGAFLVFGSASIASAGSPFPASVSETAPLGVPASAQDARWRDSRAVPPSHFPASVNEAGPSDHIPRAAPRERALSGVGATGSAPRTRPESAALPRSTVDD